MPSFIRFLAIGIIKKLAKARQKTGPGAGPWAEGFFCLDVITGLICFFKAFIISLCSVLVTFCIKPKRRSLLERLKNNDPPRKTN